MEFTFVVVLLLFLGIFFLILGSTFQDKVYKMIGVFFFCGFGCYMVYVVWALRQL